MGNDTNDESPEVNRAIREYFTQETDEELRMRVGDMVFTLVRISPDDKENIQRFSPYHYESVIGKYGMILDMSCVQDFFVFDEREYAVDFIMFRITVDND